MLLPTHCQPCCAKVVTTLPPYPPTIFPPFRELLQRGLEPSFVEEEVEAASVGKGSVAVGEVADNLEADLVVVAAAGGLRGVALLVVVGSAQQVGDIYICTKPSVCASVQRVSSGIHWPGSSGGRLAAWQACLTCSTRLPPPAALQRCTRSTWTPTYWQSLWGAQSSCCHEAKTMLP